MLAPLGAKADQFGGYITPQLYIGPSANVTLVSFNLAKSKFEGGVSPGVGLGVTFIPTTAPWASMGVDVYASFRLGQGLPNQGAFSLMGHFANYVFIGVGPTITEGADGEKALVQWSILGGIGVPIGGAPSYANKPVASN
jgi:hypothetical protein